MEKASSRLTYETPYLAKLVHSFPRFDLSLHRVNATFLPESHNYKEVMYFDDISSNIFFNKIYLTKAYADIQ